MKAFKEIGFSKLFKFILYTFWQGIFKLMIFPPMRVIWLRMFGAKIERGAIIHNIKLHNLYHHGLKNLSIGTNCFIAPEVLFDLSEKISLDDEVCIGEGTIFSTHLKIGYKGHPLQKYFPVKKAPIKIGKGSFVGVGSIILAGVTIGKYSFISPGTTVRRNVADWTMLHPLYSYSEIKIKRNNSI